MFARVRLPAWSPLHAWRLARFVGLTGFVLLVARFWLPYYGFTYFLQIGQEVEQTMVPGLKDGPVYIHETGSYDGCYYVQVATDPSLRDPALSTAIDDAGYRARRILLSAAAWVLGAGDPIRTAHVYAWLNVIGWFGLAALLWRIFPPGDWRAELAWGGILFGAGVLFSVRLALTDLVALALTAAALGWVEAGRPGRAAAWVGLAGLTRDTGILSAVTLVADWREPRRFWRIAGRLLLAVLPLACWLAYVRYALGGSSAGQRNFAWPLAGWLARWPELAAGGDAAGNPTLRFASLLEHLALTVQAAYLLLRPKKDCPWWQTGAAYLVLLVCQGHAVWGGFPNAASRVLLPLTLAFNVRAVRNRAAVLWLMLGNLSVPAGVLCLWYPPGQPQSLPAHSTWSHWQAAETDARWHVAEWNSQRRWAWCAQAGGLTVSVWPHEPQVQLELELKGRTPRDLEILHGGVRVWRGQLTEKPAWITLPPLPAQRGRITLELRTTAPPVSEGNGPHDRQLGFACFGVRRAP